MLSYEKLNAGLFLPESPRWVRDELWVSDILGRTVFRFDELGRRESVVVFDGDQSGIDFDEAGNLYVVLMQGCVLLRVAGGAPTVVADLSGVATSLCNDLVVAPDGTAFVSQLGFDPWKGEAPRQSCVIRVDTNGAATTIGPEMGGPNGLALTPDQRQLFVAEPGGGNLWRFDLDERYDVVDANVFAHLDPAAGSQMPFGTPDGICLDSQGRLWVADPTGSRVVRVESDGSIEVMVEFPGLHPLAVAVTSGANPSKLFVTVVANVDIYAPRVNPTGFVAVATLPAEGGSG